MAIPLQTAALWADENRRQPFSGSLLQLGRQSMFFDRPAFVGFCREYSLRVATHDPNQSVDDLEFFRALGFDRIESSDVSDAEQPTYQNDLNVPLPDEFANRFDCVYDGGTLEHVFEITTGLKSMARAVRLGGRAIHMAVMSNYIDHGFYQICPTLLWDFYGANGFRVERVYLVDLLVSGSLEFLHPWRVYRYEVGCCDHFNTGAWGFSPRPAAVWFVATKTEHRDTFVAPHQSLYSRWAAAGEKRFAPASNPLKQWIKRHGRSAYLKMVELRRWWHTPRPPFVGTITAEGRIQKRVGWGA